MGDGVLLGFKGISERQRTRENPKIRIFRPKFQTLIPSTEVKCNSSRVAVLVSHLGI